MLVVLQGMDASGKDGTVKHCIGGLNPMSVRVAGFKAPSSTELAHDFLWRIHQVLPQRGEIGIFNRSHYEDVLVVRVEELVPKAVWKRRYAAINAFEEHLANEGTTVVKFFLHISAGRAGEALPRAHLRSDEELEVLGRRPREARASGTSTCTPTARCSSAPRPTAAPWHVVPADHKWVRDAVVTEVLTQTLEGLDLKWPELAPELRGVVVPQRPENDAEGPGSRPTPSRPSHSGNRSAPTGAPAPRATCDRASERAQRSPQATIAPGVAEAAACTSRE